MITRCAEGARLWAAIDAAIADHKPDDIYHALQAYFCHKNGLPSKEPCRDCGGKC